MKRRIAPEAGSPGGRPGEGFHSSAGGFEDGRGTAAILRSPARPAP